MRIFAAEMATRIFVGSLFRYMTTSIYLCFDTCLHLFISVSMHNIYISCHVFWLASLLVFSYSLPNLCTNYTRCSRHLSTAQSFGRRLWDLCRSWGADLCPRKERTKTLTYEQESFKCCESCTSHGTQIFGFLLAPRSIFLGPPISTSPCSRGW